MWPWRNIAIAEHRQALLAKCVKPILKFGAAGIGIACVVLLLKFMAAHVSGSAALFSDALESLVNVAAAALALYALVAGAKPADRQHPYGHAKVELLSAVATGAMILLAAFLIFQRSLHVILHPVPLAPLSGRLGVGLACNAAAGCINAVWAVVLFRVAKRSPALKANAHDLGSDVLTSIGTIIALIVASLLHLPILDPVIAIAIAIQVAVIGGLTVMRSLSGLLDEAPPPAMTARIQDLVRLHATGALEAHDFRIRQAGPASFLEFHLVVPGGMTVAAAHDICDRIEAALKAEMEGVVITIHVEPEVKAKHHGALVV